MPRKDDPRDWLSRAAGDDTLDEYREAPKKLPLVTNPLLTCCGANDAFPMLLPSKRSKKKRPHPELDL